MTKLSAEREEEDGVYPKMRAYHFAEGYIASKGWDKEGGE